MDWPSKRVSQGGMFNHPKAQYSKETSDLIKLLMEESRLSMMLRKKINYHLRNGEPLPVPSPKKSSSEHGIDKRNLDIIRRMRSMKRKTYEDIVASGAYEMQRYRPRPDPRQPREKAKLQLQEKMSGERMGDLNIKPMRKPNKPPPVDIDPLDEIDELLNEINERAEWFAEMEELGEGKKYKELIHSQIAERLNEIKRIEKRIARENGKEQGHHDKEAQ